MSLECWFKFGSRVGEKSKLAIRYVKHVKFNFIETFALVGFPVGMEPVVHIAAEVGGGGKVETEYELLLFIVYLLLAEEWINCGGFNDGQEVGLSQNGFQVSESY